MKKILVCVLMFVMLLPSIAFAETVQYPDPYAVQPSGYEYYVVYEYDGDLWLAWSPNVIKYSGPGELQTLNDVDRWLLYDGQWDEYGLEASGITYKTWWFWNIIGSNHDILDISTGEVFFSPPKVSALVQTMGQAGPTLLEVMGPLIIPIVLLIVSLVAFRKAWEFLLRAFRTS
ncbi:MAG: hypothetical protein H0Z24_10200 [Thermosipho sp. (in: Bacteria)]|nr:hypothetical protein [Thermosipho sp. (in: thermotogales)]